jgi:hypothetical protein
MQFLGTVVHRLTELLTNHCQHRQNIYHNYSNRSLQLLGYSLIFYYYYFYYYHRLSSSQREMGFFSQGLTGV